jgi:hypothetical protein
MADPGTAAIGGVKVPTPPRHRQRDHQTEGLPAKCAFYGKSFGERRDSSAKTIATDTRAKRCYSTSPPPRHVEAPYRYHPAASESELGGHFAAVSGISLRSTQYYVSGRRFRQDQAIERAEAFVQSRRQ